MFLFCNALLEMPDEEDVRHDPLQKPKLNLVEDSLLGQLFGCVSLEGDIGKGDKHLVIVDGCGHHHQHRRVKTAETILLDQDDFSQEDDFDDEEESDFDSLCYSTEDDHSTLDFENSSDWLETAPLEERNHVLAEYRRYAQECHVSDDEDNEEVEDEDQPPATFITVPQRKFLRDVPPYFQVQHEVRYLGQCEEGFHLRVLETTWARQHYEKVASAQWVLGRTDYRHDIEVHEGRDASDGSIRWTTVSNHTEARCLENTGAI
mmetsp:Transcript_17843/g.26421  ORF Transcript_17843/g.26421 Transcript_17843/m.26421 type:complete len:262 (-) Transcript_17843:149-934(-)|eukprot:CAMPEP_0194048322 /NCGR_PEP_ID=MMETSP0009_2-20130614/26898_1 /TAXON_ID=210454 /ORGANISM="Grammatophora oceanica, Strain CCMP 410" /LENGTH=261 /DNA_ID=CAMNT_0038694159 /DNA_START=142 /DNA_END=927 /DNA_ORIENTATION=+